MNNSNITNLEALNLDSEAFYKIKSQTNYIGLQNNYADGDIVNLVVEGKTYQTSFYKAEALIMNSPPTCSNASIFLQNHPVNNIEDGLEKLKGLLNLQEPVSQDILFAAIHDHNYYHNLMVCKDAPDMLKHLLDNPPLIETFAEKTDEKTALQLVAKVAKSMIEWTKTGFSKVDDLTYERRIRACMKCRFLKDPPQTIVYKLASITKKEQADRKICTLCGCLVSNKARLSHEICPLSHPTIEGKSLWE